MNAARSYVEQSLDAMRYFTRDGQKILGDPTVVYEFLLEHGIEYRGTPWSEFKGSGWRRKRERHCFQNAFHAAVQYGLQYVEGYAYAGLIPVHHAWNVDDQGRVVDFTWREANQNSSPATWEYFGVTFDIEKLARFMRGRPTWSCLFDLPYDKEDVNLYVAA